ncbi:MAG: SUMF1/EgtB/PvdO family nonheme iron enzyme [Verrucomicrobiales bacterium]|nr:SUMF1/EgtB/PvdO family nonheme iron enzyme [Verrucomicrobiales bacterium]
MKISSQFIFFYVVIYFVLGRTVVAEEKIREWTSATGGHKIMAKLVEIKSGVVTLQKEDGQNVSISLSKLSVDDQRHVKQSDFGIPAGQERDFGGIQFVWCPPGTFLMGSPTTEYGRQEDEIQHKVTLTDGFWIAKFECTQEDYEEITGEDSRSYPRGRSHPVNRVTWNQAMAFCDRLNQKENAIPDGWKAALPTEAQWEYACRAGSDTAYCFGDDLKELAKYAWYAYSTVKRGGAKPERVGSKRANQWGIHDMHGNISEWCFDQYGDYSDKPQINPIGPSGRTSSPKRVIRGGASDSGWSYSGGTESITFQGALDGDGECRSAWRDKRPEDNVLGKIGFRVVLIPDDKVN